MSTRTDQQLFGAISGGSTAFHGPLVMPAWWQSLTEQQQFPPMAPMSYVTMMSEQSAGDLTSIWL
jgi:hypothetical protein